MRPNGFNFAMYARTWAPYNSEPLEKQLTKKELEEIQKQFPKEEKESRTCGKKSKEELLKLNPFFENNLIKELVSMIQRINPSKINDHENLKLKLEAIKQELMVVLAE